jgi:hypothetical protein
MFQPLLIMLSKRSTAPTSCTSSLLFEIEGHILQEYKGLNEWDFMDFNT